MCVGCSYCCKPFEQLDCEPRQCWVMFVVNVFGQDNYEVVAMTTVLSQGLLQRGHNIRRRLQTDDVVGDREGQFDCLDQDLTRTLRAAAGQYQQEGGKKENEMMMDVRKMGRILANYMKTL